MDFNSLFRKAVESGASDIHLQGGRRPIVRLHGALVRSEGAAVADEELRAQISRMLPEHLRGNVREELARGLDFSYADSEAGRFRCSAYCTLGQIGMTMRS